MKFISCLSINFKQSVLNLCCVLALLVICTNLALAQDRVLNGTVTDNAQNPLPGVSVRVIGELNGTSTNATGKYSLKVNPSDTLLFSYVGYISQQIIVGNSTTLDIVLIEDTKLLDEVVVTALGLKKEKRALGYAVQEIEGEGFTEARETNMVNSLAGRVAGVNITNGNSGPGSTSRIVIRGEISLAGDNQPLFVVDGVPINNSPSKGRNSSRSNNLNVDYGNGAAEINPDDIESISILKGPSAAALYGSRAANGVVLVTTKSAKRGTFGIDISTNLTFEDVLTSPDYQDQYGQGKAGQFSFVDGFGGGIADGVDESWGPKLDGRLIAQFDSPTSTGLRGGDVHGLEGVYGTEGLNLARRGTIEATPWVHHGDPVEEFFELGVTSNTNLALYGGNDKGRFRLSFSNLNNKGMLPNTDLRRNTITINGDYKLTDKFQIFGSSSYIMSESDNRHVNGYGTESVMYLFTWYGMNLNTKSLKEYWQRGLEGIQQFNYNYNYHDNPYFTMNENTNGLEKNRLIGNVRGVYTFNDKFSLQLRSGIDYFSELRQIKRAFSTQRFPKGQYREDQITYREINTDFLFSFNDTSGDFGYGLNLGGNRMVQDDHYSFLSANQLVIPNVYNFRNTSIPLESVLDIQKKRINSLYAAGSVSFKNMYFVELTGRNDWSSTLPKANNSYFYPSVTVSAILSDIFKLKDNSAISFAKLRLGLSQVGNDTNPYALNNVYSFGTAFGSNLTAREGSVIPNQDLKPEKLTSFEVGADIRFLDDRLNLDATYYNTVSKNQILDIELPASSGYDYRRINAGEIQSQGVELMLSAIPVQNKNFRWSTSLNFSRDYSEVKELAEGLQSYTYLSNSIIIDARVGERMGTMWGTGFQKHDGKIVYNITLDQAWKDATGNDRYVIASPIEDNTLRNLGNYNPDFMLGFSNSFKYKNIDFSFLFDLRYGGKVLSRTRLIAATSGNIKETLYGRSVEEGGQVWQSYDEVDGNYISKDVVGPVIDGYVQVGDDFVAVNKLNNTITIDGKEYNLIGGIEASAYHNLHYKRQHEEQAMYDATYLKLRELNIGYNLPNKTLKKWGLPIKSAKISFVGRNLLLWTQNPHFDPEMISFNGSGQIVPNVEDMNIPSARSFGFNISLKL